jgi:hypothetical protein
LNSLKDILVNTGAIAGFAGIVGLAVLAMLYFSQARDVRRLREWAGREPERAAEVELRAQQIASQAIAQAYESMAMRQSEADAAAGIAHEQGVEVTAHAVEPAVAEDATADQDEPQERSGETQAYDVLAAEMGGEAVAEQAIEEHADSEEAGAEDEEQVQQPAEVAAEGTAEHTAASENGQTGSETEVHPAPAEGEAESEERPSLLAPSTPAAARAAAPMPPLPPLDTSEFRAVNRPPTPQIPDYYLHSGDTGSGHFDAIEPTDNRRSRVPFAVAGVLVAVFAVILIATQIGGGDNTDNAPNQKQAQRQKRDTKTPSTAPRNPEINRPAVNVSVLNGTDTSGLAKVVGDQLVQAGFTSTTTGNRNDGTNHAESTVYYAAGNKLEAQEVAKELKIKSVKEADEQTLAAGGSVPVIVVLGADIEN